MSIPLTDTFGFTPNKPNIDKRYLANNGQPYTSVSAAETALASRLVATCVGLTVLVKESGWTEAKEYWVQPKGTTPETYGLVDKHPQIDTSGFATKQEVNAKQDALPSGTAGQVLKKTVSGVAWGNMPSFEDGENTAVTLEGTIHVSTVDAQEGEGAGVSITQNTGDGGGVNMTFTLPKGDTGADGQDGSDGHNPCLGVFADESSLPTTDVREGDYAYASVTDSTTQTTASHIFRYDGTQWQDNGEGSPDNQTAFDGGEGPAVASMKIDDTGLANPAENALALAKDIPTLVKNISGGGEDAPDLYITDEEGNALVEFGEGHIKTMNFDSRDAQHVSMEVVGTTLKITI